MNGDQLSEQASRINSRADFLRFLDRLIDNHAKYSSEWENDTLELFLKSLTRFANDADGYYSNVENSKFDVEKASWQFFAEMLLAAKIYE